MVLQQVPSDWSTSSLWVTSPQAHLQTGLSSPHSQVSRSLIIGLSAHAQFSLSLWRTVMTYIPGLGSPAGENVT